MAVGAATKIKKMFFNDNNNIIDLFASYSAATRYPKDSINIQTTNFNLEVVTHNIRKPHVQFSLKNISLFQKFYAGKLLGLSVVNYM